MTISSAFSKLSIKKQILISYAPMLIVLGFLSLTSYQNFETFFTNFDQLSDVTEQNLFFRGIEKDVIELQRTTLVYSYVGYRGVLRKVEFLQSRLEQKFEGIRPVIAQDQEISDRFIRLYDHYQDYKEGFSKSVEEKNKLDALTKQNFEPLIYQSHELLAKVIRNLEANQRFESVYLASQIQANLLRVSLNSRSFSAAPDGSLIKVTNALLLTIEKEALILQSRLKVDKNKAALKDFVDLLHQYQETFIEIVTVNSVYLHLVNVVLAGKAAEIDKLSSELGEIEGARAQELGGNIEVNIKGSRNSYLVLSAVAASIGLIGALLIAMGIARPVVAMANTLSQLAKGVPHVEIPGLERKDEVGEMAKAANEFKLMAERLEQQSDELEEFAYRTSHDLRSPLVSSIGVLQLVSETISDTDKDDAKEGVRLVQGSLEKLEMLVQDIHALTKTKNAEEAVQDINFGEIVDEALMKFSHLVNFEKLEIRRDLHLSKKYAAQKSRVVLIVENMITNAIKYQDPDKTNPFIKISARNEKESVIFSVEDNGLGVPVLNQSKLFTMFLRFHPKVSYGSGLGLYMMKKSADVLKGTITFKDTGGGSLFQFTG